METKKEIVEFFLKQNILLSPDLLGDEEKLRSLMEVSFDSKEMLILNEDVKKILLEAKGEGVNWVDLEKAKSHLEKGKDPKLYTKFVSSVSEKREEPKEQSVKISFSYNEESKQRDIQDFVSYFNARYEAIEKILRNRDLKNMLSINRLAGKRDRDHISLIGLVADKRETKNNNIMLVVEDPTGTIKVLVNKNKPELYAQAQDIVLDEVIAISGVNGDNIVFANSIAQPDIPLHKELKKSPDEVYAAFLSDIHVGSNNFLPEDFNRFLEWINLRAGNDEQKAIAEKVKYVFIVGDLVDGCGIYPDQDKELVINDIYRQYNKCAELLAKIPSHIKLIICPGNHDAMRMAEPQPALYKDFAEPIYNLKNAFLVSNPAMVNIHGSENFSGFDVLLYHGYSFDHFIANVSSIRNGGGYDRADIVMKFLLQRRHLAPTHSSTLYIPDVKQDPLVIDKIPDFFVTGHIHKSIAANYRNVTMICGSCWQSKTTFQEKVGHNPEPSRVPVINLKNRNIKILKFG